MDHRSTRIDSVDTAQIVHLCERLPVGGMEHIVACLVRGIQSAEFESAVWSIEESDLLGQELTAQGFDIVELGRRHRRDVGLFGRIATLIRRRRVAVLHCHDELSWFYGTIGARLSGRRTRVVVTMHGRRSDISTRHLREQRVLAVLTSRIVCVSEFLRAQLLRELRLPKGRVTTILNGIPLSFNSLVPRERDDACARLGISSHCFVIGSVGELSTVKNLGLTLEAASRIRRSVPNLLIVFIGEGRERASLQRKAEELGLAEQVVFAGLRRDVPAVLPALDVYVCSSDYEGISLSILEAMARGRPIVATSVGGNPELVRDEHTGLLVPSRDAVALAAAVTRLERDPALRRQLGTQAQSLALDRYSVDRMVRDYSELYRTILARQSPVPVPRAVPIGRKY